MAPRHDVLDQPDELRKPLALSVVFHGLLAAVLMLYGALENSSNVQWGDPKSLGGGTVGITPVNRIPLPSRDAPTNPVSNDTQSQVPQKVEEQPKRAQTKREDPDAIPLKSRNQPRTPSQSSQRYQAQPPKPNQVYSSTGAAASSPLYSASGAGGVGSAVNASPFGYGFAWYEQLIREKVARNWRTEQLDPQLQLAPPAVIFFEILRDGSVRNVRVQQSSGNFALDQSAQRAVIQSAPFQPLPPQFQRDVAPIEFWFRLKR